MPSNVRRVVIGHDAVGKAIVLADGTPETVVEYPNSEFYSAQIWVTKSTPVPLGIGVPIATQPLSFVPPANGSTMRIIQIPPEAESIYKIDIAGAKAAFANLGGEGVSTFTMDGPHPLMHRTESLDYGIVLEGEITMVLDDSEVLLRAGDVIVHLGTNHAWSNRSGKICRMAFILIDGRYCSDLKFPE